MADLTTKYLGLSMTNPLIVGSSGLTDSVDNILELEKAGAGAVVLKSLFEEQIMLEVDASLKEAYKNDMIYSAKSETLDYIDVHIRERTMGAYIELIKEAKDKAIIPVIASINCVSAAEWTNFANQFEEAGADALELNIAILPTDENTDVKDIEDIYVDIVKKIKQKISIPVAVKISPYFTNLSRTVKKLGDAGADGIVMFNRFYTPDYDINNFSEKSSDTFSKSSESGNVRRWMGIISPKVDCDLSATTGIHSSEDLIKNLLAGAVTAQIVSAIYKNGKEQIQKILGGLNEWMDEKGYNTIEQFRGKLSQAETSNPSAYERIQFMKYFSEIR
ncbi:MAG TPA: dihydroorotate dehydrogenase-like protein [Bacteroidales bacterium]|nr:dihydroorotate dehydrogenase-like protein [Bacteroidales bacterium]